MRNRLIVLIVIPLVFALSGCIPQFFAFQSDPGTVSVRDKVNSLPYAWGVPEPAMEAFELVARKRGWSKENIQQWKPFAQAVMQRESGWCFNLRRGAQMAAPGVDCSLSKQGRYSDSGFGQVIRVHYRPGSWMCTQEGLCSSDSIIGSPWSSMIAFVSLLEHAGRQPWCYTASLRASSTCRLAPAGLPK